MGRNNVIDGMQRKYSPLCQYLGCQLTAQTEIGINNTPSHLGNRDWIALCSKHREIFLENRDIPLQRRRSVRI
jgi:hypothetical protein